MFGAAAIALFGGMNRGNLGNMWFLSNNPDIANFQTGETLAPSPCVSTPPIFLHQFSGYVSVFKRER